MSSDAVRRHHPGRAESSSTVGFQSADGSSDGDEDGRTCLRTAVVITLVLGVCVLIPVVVVAVRLLTRAERRRTPRRPLVLRVPRPSADDDDEKPFDRCSVCDDDPSLPNVCRAAAGGITSRTKFVVLTAVPLQPRRSPGAGYRQIVQPSSTTIYPCRSICPRNSHSVRDATDNTTAFPRPHFPHHTDGDFV